LEDVQGRRSKLRRVALVAAPAVVLLGVAAALLLWPAEPAPAPPRALVAADPAPPPPLAAPPEKPRPRPRPKRVEKKPLKIEIDRRAAPPVAVSVPAVGISAPTIALGLRRDGKLEVPKDFSEAGWREGGPEPGERGAAMITGHVDSRSGQAAFYSLREVGRGDEIRVRRKDRTTVTFVTERTEWVPKTGFPTRRVYGRTRLPTLRLVTCGGPFNKATGHYRDNLIVYATRKPS
jgi:hypothetical protein